MRNIGQVTLEPLLANLTIKDLLRLVLLVLLDPPHVLLNIELFLSSDQQTFRVPHLHRLNLSLLLLLLIALLQMEFLTAPVVHLSYHAMLHFLLAHLLQYNQPQQLFSPTSQPPCIQPIPYQESLFINQNVILTISFLFPPTDGLIFSKDSHLNFSLLYTFFLNATIFPPTPKQYVLFPNRPIPSNFKNYPNTPRIFSQFCQLYINSQPTTTSNFSPSHLSCCQSPCRNENFQIGAWLSCRVGLVSFSMTSRLQS